jgi:hypothetical protein
VSSSAMTKVYGYIASSDGLTGRGFQAPALFVV